MENTSKFSGGLLGLIGISFLAGLLASITLGIGTPWAVCMVMNWYAKHITIDGKKVTFDGNGGQLFGQYIKWLLLTIITCGIYGLWLSIKMVGWVVSHTHLAEAAE